MTDSVLDKLLDDLDKIVKEVKETEQNHTRNAATDYHCRCLIVDHGDALLTLVRIAKTEERQKMIRGGLGT